MKLSVVIVNYNVKDYLYQCIDSVLKAMEGIDGEVIVVDNHSRDGSVEYVKAAFPQVNYIHSSHNLGFSRANNIAIKQSKGEYVLLLNPDTVVGDDVFRQAIAFMDAHPEAGAAGVRMLKADGTVAMESRRGLPTPMVSFYKMSGLCQKYPQSKRFAKYYMSWLPWDEANEIEVVSGAFFFLRKAALDRVGLLDEDYFMYGEDIDLSCRLLKDGWHNWYLPLNILHYKGESTEKSSFRYVHVFYDAMLIFFRKHYGKHAVWLTFPVKTAIYAKVCIEIVRMAIKKLKKSMGFAHDVVKRGNTKQIIFDSSKMTYTEMLKEMYANSGEQNLEYGIFHPEKGTLITLDKVIFKDK